MRGSLFGTLVGLTLGPVTAFGADAYLPPPIPQSIPSFAGFYVAGGAGYGVSVQRNFVMQDSIPVCCGFNTSASGQVAAQGYFGSAIVGYNIQYGPLLTGLELTGRWGREGATGLPARTTIVGAGGVTGQMDHAYEFRSDAGVNIAGRFGVVFNQTLVFAKAGIGVAHAEDRFAFQGSGATCIFPSFDNVIGRTICLSSVAVGSAAATLGRWSPSMLAGVGIEHNFGIFFVRAGAEIEGITGLKGVSTLSGPIPTSGTFLVNASSEPFWTTRGTALVGVRF